VLDPKRPIREVDIAVECCGVVSGPFGLMHSTIAVGTRDVSCSPVYQDRLGC
jgi:hypothetical protein